MYLLWGAVFLRVRELHGVPLHAAAAGAPVHSDAPESGRDLLDRAGLLLHSGHLCPLHHLLHRLQLRQQWLCPGEERRGLWVPGVSGLPPRPRLLLSN